MGTIEEKGDSTESGGEEPINKKPSTLKQSQFHPQNDKNQQKKGGGQSGKNKKKNKQSNWEDELDKKFDDQLNSNQ